MEGKKHSDQKPTKNSQTAFRVGTLCLVFLVIGYESALFVRRATALAVQFRRDNPDTVYVVDEQLARRVLQGTGAAADRERTAWQDTEVAGSGERGRSSAGSRASGAAVVVRRDADHPAEVQKARSEARRVESFRFNPNTVSVEDLVRLGFSSKQAESIDSYRAKGGVFRRKSDFAKSYVVSDSIFRRLEPYIDIPKLDINKADSAAFDALPGIGPYFAAKLVQTREELGGYSCKEQLLHIWNFDQQKYEGLKDLIVCSRPAAPFALWSLPADRLREHPYIRNWQIAKSIVFYREHNARELWTLDGLRDAGVIDEQMAAKLALCLIEDPRQEQ